VSRFVPTLAAWRSGAANRSVGTLVPGVGFEPTLPLGTGGLSPLRLPVTPPGRVDPTLGDGRPGRARPAGPQPTLLSQFRAFAMTSLNGLLVSKLGSRGRPSTRSPMPLRCISLVPAAMEVTRPLR
jgi:hypothetical protein